MVIMRERLVVYISMLYLVSDYGNCCHGVILDITAFADRCENIQPNATRPPVYGVIGKPVFLHCMASGSPDLVYSWKRNGGLIDDNTFPNGTLAIYNYIDDKSGRYLCIVNNKCNTNIDAADYDIITAGELSVCYCCVPCVAVMCRMLQSCKCVIVICCVFMGVANTGMGNLAPLNVIREAL